MKTTAVFLTALALNHAAWAADTPEAAADRMLDPTRNASAFKDPKAFSEWVGNMMNPATSLALAQRGIDPNTSVRMMAAGLSPATMQNYIQFSDPAVLMKWMAAGMDPNFYASLMAQGLNPANYLGWMTAPLSPQALGLMAAPLNPGLYANWMAAPISPQAVNAMMAPMNPNLYMNWMGAGMNPATYGTWGQMLTAPAQTVGATPAASAPANPLDPAALMKMLPIPGAQPGAQ